MINRFHVSSFKSFNDGFTFTADRPSGDRNATSTVVGRNNSGKSNFTEAFDFLKDLVLRRKGLNDIAKIRNLDHPSQEPISFEIDFTTYFEYQEFRFVYSLAIDPVKRSVLSESFKAYFQESEYQIIETRGSTRLFKSMDTDDIIRVNRRDGLVFRHLFSDHPGFDQTNTDFFQSRFKNHSVFDRTVFGPVYALMNWFINLRVITPQNTKLTSGPMLHVNELLDCFDLSDKLRFVDSGPSIHEVVRDIFRSRSMEEYKYLMNDTKDKIGAMGFRGIDYYYNFDHGVLSVKHFEIFRKGIWTPVSGSYLSEGIQRIIAFFPILTEEFQNVTIIVDELDRKIHTNLTLKLIELFQMRNRRQQLIFTTHETEVLNSDLIDPENLWIIDKEAGAGSYLYRCDSYRLDRSLGDLYIEDELIRGMP